MRRLEVEIPRMEEDMGAITIGASGLSIAGGKPKKDLPKKKKKKIPLQPIKK